jgi:hypothetical protein
LLLVADACPNPKISHALVNIFDLHYAAHASQKLKIHGLQKDDPAHPEEGGGCVVADYCASAGAYHLSCYAASVTSDDAQAAKAQCFSEWAK